MQYFISYYFTDSENKQGFANCDYLINNQIKSYDDITLLTQKIKDKFNFKSCIILNVVILQK